MKVSFYVVVFEVEFTDFFLNSFPSLCNDKLYSQTALFDVHLKGLFLLFPFAMFANIISQWICDFFHLKKEIQFNLFIYWRLTNESFVKYNRRGRILFCVDFFYLFCYTIVVVYGLYSWFFVCLLLFILSVRFVVSRSTKWEN